MIDQDVQTSKLASNRTPSLSYSAHASLVVENCTVPFAVYPRPWIVHYMVNPPVLCGELSAEEDDVV